MHAGSLRVVAGKKIVEPDQNAVSIYDQETRSELNSASNWLNFSNKSFEVISTVKSNFESLESRGDLVAYGASGRASMWIHVAALDFVKYVVDGSPLRSNHFMPGTDIRIETPEFFNSQAPYATFVTAWNYFEGIIKQHPNYRGLWITPLPKYLEIQKR
jgi:hypothetical protein